MNEIGIRSKGQGLVEYALILVLVGIISISGLNLLGVDIRGLFTDLVSSMSGTGGEEASPGGDPADDEEVEQQVTLFWDNFLEDEGMWPSIKDKKQGGLYTGVWNVKDGEMRGGSLALSLLEDFSGSDYVFSVGSPQLDNYRDRYQGFGVLFRSENEDRLNGYMFEIERVSISDPGIMYFSQWVNGYQVVPPLSSVPVPADFNWADPGDLTVDVSGDTFTAYFDGNQVLQAEDSLYTEGTVGVATNYGTKMTIDSIKIEGAP